MKRVCAAMVVAGGVAGWGAGAWGQDCSVWQHPDRAWLDNTAVSMAWDPLRRELDVFTTRIQGDRSDFMVCRDGRVESLGSFPGEPGLAGHRPCFDPLRGVLVALGRESPVTYLWDGQAWEVRPAPPEMARSAGTMVFDEVRGVIVVLVNEQGPWYRLTAWEWDGSLWRRSTAQGPPESDLSDLAMGFDAASGRVLLVRQLAQPQLWETWLYDGQVWTLANSGSPGLEDTDRLFTDAGTGRVFGVSTNGAERRWDGTAWVDGPGWPLGTEFAAEYDRAGDRLFTQPVFIGDLRVADRQASRPLLRPGPGVYGVGYWDEARRRVRMAGALDPDHAACWERVGGDWREDDAWGVRPYDGGATVPTGDGATFAVLRPPSSTAGASEWRGGRWQNRRTTGGPGLAGFGAAAVATDLARGRTVSFGGSGNNGSTVIINDLWELEPGTGRWTQVPVSGAWPTARQNASAAYDPVGRRVLVFGGSQFARFSDLWAWDGSVWSNVGGAGGPSARINAAMAFDAARNTLVLFGGRASSLVGDTWEWNGSWRLVSASGGPPAGTHLMAYDAGRGVCVLAANVAGGLAIYEYGPSGWASVGTFTTPGRAFGLSADPAGGVVVTGDTSEFSAVPHAWRWNGAAFTRLTSPAPDATQATSCYDPARRRLVVFGGEVHSGATATSTTVSDQLWEWDGAAWEHRAVTGPSARKSGAMVYESSRGRMLLFGGYGNFVVMGDTWAYDGSAWTLLATGGPEPRLAALMAHDPIRGKTLMLGGDDNGPGNGFAGLWEFDGQAWALVGEAPGGLNEVRVPLMYFDPGLGTIVFENIEGQWRRTAGGWEPVFGTPPQGDRERGVWAVHDPERGETVRLWAEHMRQPVTLVRSTDEVRILEDPEDTAAFPGQDAEISALARSAFPISAHWEHDGVPVVDGGRVSGATTRRLRIAGVRPEDAGRYRMVATTECSEVATGWATLTVACPADFNADGFLDFFDYGDFVACFEGSACPPGVTADFNRDGFADFFDYADFVAAFESGC